MISSLITPEQSFYPINNNSVKPPGLDIQHLKDSVGALNSQIEVFENEKDGNNNEKP